MPSTRIYLRDCQPGDVVQDAFIVSGKQLSATAAGKHFIKLFVSDSTAQLTARMWNASREAFAAMPESGVIRLAGRIENYQNNLQLIVEQFWPAEVGSYDLADLLPHTTRDIPKLRQRLAEVCAQIRNHNLRELLAEYMADEKLMADFSRAPAASAFHHAFIGGLIEHTVNAMDVALAIVPFYPGLNADLVVAGIFLHDIAKTWELTYDGAFAYSDGGSLVGHIVKSAMWIEHKAAAAEKRTGQKIPQDLIDVLQHIILAHHGTMEFGSPKTPATPEAIAVHMIENMDAKLMISLTATRNQQAATWEGNWTEYIKSLGGRLYRPDVAPPDAAAPATPATAPQPPQQKRPPSPPQQPQQVAEVKLYNPLFEMTTPRKP